MATIPPNPGAALLIEANRPSGHITLNVVRWRTLASAGLVAVSRDLQHPPAVVITLTRAGKALLATSPMQT